MAEHRLYENHIIHTQNYAIFSILQDIFKYDCIIVDEVQCLAPEIIDRLSDLVDTYGITVICYGLRTDFQSHLFPGAQRLMELADDIEQIRTICWCGKRAHFNARLLNGEMVTEGEQVQLGGNESYISLCRKL